MANKLGVKREVVIEAVNRRTGVNLHMVNTSERLAVALQFLEALRHGEKIINAKTAGARHGPTVGTAA